MAFAPAAYARGFSLVLKGDLDAGCRRLAFALAADPLVADAASARRRWVRGLAALRQGRVTDAIAQLETVVGHAGNSSEAHRMLATAYGIMGISRTASIIAARRSLESTR